MVWFCRVLALLASGMLVGFAVDPILAVQAARFSRGRGVGIPYRFVAGCSGWRLAHSARVLLAGERSCSLDGSKVAPLPVLGGMRDFLVWANLSTFR